MSKEPELKARDKVVVRMTREGAVEENLTAGTEQRVSKRLEDSLRSFFFSAEISVDFGTCLNAWKTNQKPLSMPVFGCRQRLFFCIFSVNTVKITR